VGVAARKVKAEEGERERKGTRIYEEGHRKGKQMLGKELSKSAHKEKKTGDLRHEQKEMKYAEAENTLWERKRFKARKGRNFRGRKQGDCNERMMVN